MCKKYVCTMSCGDIKRLALCLDIKSSPTWEKQIQGVKSSKQIGLRFLSISFLCLFDLHNILIRCSYFVMFWIDIALDPCPEIVQKM